MAYKFNVFTGTLDIVNGSAATSGVFGVPPSTDKAIPRWVGVGADTLDTSKAIIQNGGAVQAQGFLTRRVVDDVVEVPSGYSWIAPSIELSSMGSIEIDEDAELIIE